MNKPNESAVAPLESQMGLVQLEDAITKALGGKEFETTPEPAQTLQLASRVVIDDANPGSIAKSAFNRITGFVVTCLPLEKGGNRKWCGRWRYMAPRFDKNVIVGRPSIAVTEKWRVQCTDEKCGHLGTVFFDLLMALTKPGGKGVMCEKCGAKTIRTRTTLRCDGAGDLAKGEDDVFAGAECVAEELSYLDDLFSAGYTEDVGLIMPRLWCGYMDKPQIEYVAGDRMAEQLVRKGRAKWGAYMVPFDLMMPYHTAEHAQNTPCVQQLVLETITGSGWVTQAELEGNTRTSWTRRWLGLPQPRAPRETVSTRRVYSDL